MRKNNFLSVLTTALLIAISLPVTSYAAVSPELTSDELTKLTGMSLKGDHAQVVDYLENRIGQDEPNTRQLYELCHETIFAGLYGRMTSCFEKLQRKSVDGRVFVSTNGVKEDFTSFVYIDMARGYTIIAEYAKAITAAKRALESVDAKKIGRESLLMSTLAVLGYAEARNGDKEQARETAKQLATVNINWPPNSQISEEIKRGANSPKDFGLVKIYTATGDFAQALEAYDKTEPRYSPEMDQLMAKTMGSTVWGDTKSFGLIRRGLNRGHLLLELDRVAEARQSFDASFSDSRSSHLGEEMGVALYDRGRIAEREGKPAEAIEFYRRAVEVIEGLRASINSESSKIGYVGNKQDVYAHLIKALIVANRPGEAFEYAERAKARALVDMMASREKFERAAGSESNALLPALAQLNTDLEKFNLAKATPEQLQKNQQTRNLARVTTEQLQKTDYELASFVTVAGISEAKLRELLQPDETLVEYYYLGNDLYAFVATKSTIRAVRLEGAGLSAAVHEFRTAVQNPQSKDIARLSRELHDRLIAPLGLPAKGKLLLVPHGALHYVPFNALSNGTDSVIDRYTLRLLPSASVMSFLNQRKPSGKGLIVFGNPDLGDPQYDLPGAQKEAEEIARLRPGSTILMRADATKTAAQKLAGSFAYLHFASHGKFDSAKPLQSGIYLANDRDTGASGTLTVDELYSLNLNADLVTLSACETALGNIDNGDDVVGLTRGFFYAGVSSIISSLWPVDDQATYQLMTRFYGELDKTSKTEALRKAQLGVKAKFPHPFYWAAFQLTGNR